MATRTRNLIEQFTDGLLDDVIHDIARGVIDTARLAHLGLFFEGDALALRTDDFAEEAFVHTAEDFDGDEIEEVGRFVVAEIADETREPFVADDQRLAEVLLEEVAVEEWHVRRRTAVERTKVPDDEAPEGILGGSYAFRAIADGRRFIAQFEGALARTSAFLAAIVPPPRLDNALELRTGVDVAVLADAEKENAIEDVLDGFVELVVFEKFVPVVAADEVGGEFPSCFVEEFEKVGVERAGTVRLDKPLLPGLALAGGFALGKRFEKLIYAAAANLFAGKEVPDLLRDKRELFVVPRFPLAHLRLVEMWLAANDVDVESLEVGQDGDRQVFVPRIAFGLEGVAGVKFLGWFLGLAHEAITAVGAEEVISAFLPSLNLRTALDLDLAFRLDQLVAIFQVPAERAKKRVEEIVTKLGLDIAAALEFGYAALEVAHETIQLLLE